MESNRSGRDSSAIQRMLEGQDMETAGKIRSFLAKADTAEEQDILAIMALLEKNGISLAQYAESKAVYVKPCDSMVCDLMACVASSSCDGGACSTKACSANTGGYLPGSDPADCTNANTCGTEACHQKACSQNAGSTHCGNQVCAHCASEAG